MRREGVLIIVCRMKSAGVSTLVPPKAMGSSTYGVVENSQTFKGSEPTERCQTGKSVSVSVSVSVLRL